MWSRGPVYVEVVPRRLPARSYSAQTLGDGLIVAGSEAVKTSAPKARVLFWSARIDWLGAAVGDHQRRFWAPGRCTTGSLLGGLTRLAFTDAQVGGNLAIKQSSTGSRRR